MALACGGCAAGCSSTQVQKEPPMGHRALQPPIVSLPLPPFFPCEKRRAQALPVVVRACSTLPAIPWSVWAPLGTGAGAPELATAPVSPRLPAQLPSLRPASCLQPAKPSGEPARAGGQRQPGQSRRGGGSGDGRRRRQRQQQPRGLAGAVAQAGRVLPAPVLRSPCCCILKFCPGASRVQCSRPAALPHTYCAAPVGVCCRPAARRGTSRARASTPPTLPICGTASKSWCSRCRR